MSFRTTVVSHGSMPVQGFFLVCALVSALIFRNLAKDVVLETAVFLRLGWTTHENLTHDNENCHPGALDEHALALDEHILSATTTLSWTNNLHLGSSGFLLWSTHSNTGKRESLSLTVAAATSLRPRGCHARLHGPHEAAPITGLAPLNANIKRYFAIFGDPAKKLFLIVTLNRSLLLHL